MNIDDQVYYSYSQIDWNLQRYVNDDVYKLVFDDLEKAVWNRSIAVINSVYHESMDRANDSISYIDLLSTIHLLY